MREVAQDLGTARGQNVTRKIASIFGTKLIVCSWTEVSAWKRLTATPTRRPTRRIGPATRIVVSSKSRARSTMTMSSSPIAIALLRS
jgi:hypothetical protein